MQRQLEAADKDNRQNQTELQKAQLREESFKAQLSQAVERMQDFKEGMLTLKQDKEKLFSKLDHLLYENENLRSEVFMMKKIMFEMEKRDLHTNTAQSKISDRYLHELESNDRRRIVDKELEEIRNRPDTRQ